MFNADGGGILALGQLPSANFSTLSTAMLAQYPTFGLPTGNLTAHLNAASLAMGLDTGRSPGVVSTPTAGDIHVVRVHACIHARQPLCLLGSRCVLDAKAMVLETSARP